MSKKYYFDDQDDMDEATYYWLGGRYNRFEEVHKRKLQRKWRKGSDDAEDRRSVRLPKRSREYLN